jgi:hypothetical protein
LQIAPVQNMELLHRCKLLLFKTWGFCIVTNRSCSKHGAFALLQIVHVENMGLLHRYKQDCHGKTGLSPAYKCSGRRMRGANGVLCTLCYLCPRKQANYMTLRLLCTFSTSMK